MRASAESSGSSRARVGLCWACAGGGGRPADRVMGRGRGTIQSHTPFKYLRTLLTGAPITSAREWTRLHATSTKKTFRHVRKGSRNGRSRARPGHVRGLTCEDRLPEPYNFLGDEPCPGANQEPRAHADTWRGARKLHGSGHPQLLMNIGIRKGLHGDQE